MKPTNESLLLCPFCGGKHCNSANRYETPSGRDYIVRHFVECMDCEARTSEYDTEKQANLAWNTRSNAKKEN